MVAVAVKPAMLGPTPEYFKGTELAMLENLKFHLLLLKVCFCHLSFRAAFLHVINIRIKQILKEVLVSKIFVFIKKISRQQYLMCVFEMFSVHRRFVISVDLHWRKKKKSWLGLGNLLRQLS